MVTAAAEAERLAKENTLPLPPTKLKLSPSDRRIFRKALSFPWPRDGGPGFYEALAEASANDSWLSFPAQSGVTRRVIDDDPAEIVRYSYVKRRIVWNEFANPTTELPASKLESAFEVLSPFVEIPHSETYSLGYTVHETQCDESTGMWIDYLGALAVNDLEAIERMDSDLPQSLPNNSWTHPPYYCLFYDLVFGLARGDQTRVLESIGSLRIKKLPGSDSAIRDCLVAIYERSPDDFTDALLRCGKSTRRLRSIDPHAKLIDVLLHGLWALAHRVDPAIVESWDVDSRLPWDAGLHRWKLANKNAADAIDWNRVPDMRPTFIDMPHVTTFR